MSTRFTIGISHHATILGRVYEEVAAPAEMKAISYSAADGLTIPAFLTLPAGGWKRPAADRLAARRACRRRHAGFRLVGAGAGGAGLRGAAAQFSRLDAGLGFHAGRLWRMGPQDAVRPVRRRALSCARKASSIRSVSASSAQAMAAMRRWPASPSSRACIVARCRSRAFRTCGGSASGPSPTEVGLVTALLGPVHGDGGSERPGAARNFTHRACCRRERFRSC